MTKRGLFSLALKVTAIWFVALQVLNAISFLAMMYSSWDIDSTPNKSYLILAELAWVAVLVVVGVALVLLSDRIARWVIQNGEERVTWAELRLGSGSVVLLAMKCLGMFLLLDGINRMVQGLLDGITYGSSRIIYILIIGGFNLVIGSYLFFGGRAAARWVEGKRADEEAPVVGMEGWERPLFVQAVRIVGMIWLAWSLSWIVMVVVLQWIPEPFYRPIDWGGVLAAVRGVLVLVAAVYMMSGAKGMVEMVFRRRSQVSVSEDQPSTIK